MESQNFKWYRRWFLRTALFSALHWHFYRLNSYASRQEFTIPIGLVARTTKSCIVGPDTFTKMTVGLLYLQKNVCNVTCPRGKAPNTCEVYRLFKNCGSRAWNLINVTLLAPRIWKCSLHFWITCAHQLVSPSSIRIWRFSDVSGTNSVHIFRVCWVGGLGERS
jgi:hypothetical protein